ncbi:caspase domain-containing protein [Armillaria novae-zelandiae]|uniref:Caspase domain-containing protein n=1 Tax=Armillaria novae-zelandiae TaxID=153914 RepID=A0AA39T7Z4_9AGAR|nr:caspase domain-containing protein [Armillaria novae-zelandiae]
MSSHMPIPHLGASTYVESNSIPFSQYHSRIPEPMPHTPTNQTWESVDDAISFPFISTAPSNSFPCYQETYSMRPFVPCGVRQRRSGDDDMKVTAERLASLQRIEMELARHHGVDTAAFTGTEEAEEELEALCGIKVPIPNIDSAELLEHIRNKAHLHSDAKSEQALDNLRELHHLRSKFWSLLQIARIKMIIPKSISGSPYRHPDTSRFWAVIIGIDDYESYPLRGAVSDALLMKDYLQKELRMPATRIECLLSSNYRNAIFPSRRNITRKLLSLATDSQIECGDNIIIFFSGHGTSYSFSEDPQGADGIPDARRSSRFASPIEALCPADRGKPDDWGVPIPDISDREINGILHQISRNKGHQITVILDCCHSGSATRDIQAEVEVKRVAPLGSPEEMLNTAQESLSGYPDYQDVFSEGWRPDNSSHVTLAACSGFQFAVETLVKGVYNGVFTRSLVDTLRSGYCKKETTYVDLNGALPWSLLQRPVVTGDHKRELLWYRK